MSTGGALLHDWIGLLEAANELANGELRYALGESDAAMLNAIRSGAIPLRGRMRGEIALKRIDGFDLKRARFEISFSAIDLGGPYSGKSETGSFSNVQVDFAKLVEYLRENLCVGDPPLIDANPVSGAELAFTHWLQRAVQRGKRIHKAHIWKDINTADHSLYGSFGDGKLSERAFERIWATVVPDAWKRAGPPLSRQSTR